nr:MAG: replication initiator protein [Microvirus sp.]
MACHYPIKVLDKNKIFHCVPCGQCHYCKLKRVRSWIFRLKKEQNIHNHSLFITLTYENPPKQASGLATLRKRCFQLFIKRLRENTKETIKYYACGEYGSQTRRPHYHAILFGATAQDIAKAWEGYIEDDIRNGHSRVDEVTSASIAYTCKYIDKGKTIPLFKGDDRLPEFSLMSKKMGINYLTPQIIEYHKKTLNAFATLDEEKFILPRYYKDKIFNSEEKGLLNEQFSIENKEQYEKQITAAGSEEKYMRNLYSALWANQLASKKHSLTTRKQI